MRDVSYVQRPQIRRATASSARTVLAHRAFRLIDALNCHVSCDPSVAFLDLGLTLQRFVEQVFVQARRSRDINISRRGFDRLPFRTAQAWLR